MHEPTEPLWLSSDVVLDIHEAQLAEHGGLEGIRDQGLLESALHAPRDVLAYAGKRPGLCVLAAVYGCRIARNHPFHDANKRTAAVVVETFLLINGLDLLATDEMFFEAIMSVSDGTTSEDDFAQWLQQRVKETARRSR